MAKLTKVQARTFVQQLLDDTNAKLWSAANLDRLIEKVVDTRWARLLSRNGYLLSQLDEMTPASPGFIDVSVVGTPPTNLSKRFWKVQAIVRGGRTYREASQRDYVIENNVILASPRTRFRYFFYGNQVWLDPLSTEAGVEFRYAFLPTEFTSLTDADPVEFPEGFDEAYTYEAARRAIVKGNRDASQEFRDIAFEAWQDLLSTIRRRSTGPGTVYSPYPPEESGGE